MDEKDIQSVLTYVRRCVPNIDLDVSPAIQADQSYGIWAINEILERILHESELPPEYISGKETRSVEEIIYDFIDEMDSMALESTNDRTRNIFEIAKVEGQCMLMYAIWKGEEHE